MKRILLFKIIILNIKSISESISIKHINQPVKYLIKNVLGVFPDPSAGPLVPNDGTMNCPKYIKIVEKNVAPTLAKLCPIANGRFKVSYIQDTF